MFTLWQPFLSNICVNFSCRILYENVCLDWFDWISRPWICEQSCVWALLIFSISWSCWALSTVITFSWLSLFFKICSFWASTVAFRVSEESLSSLSSFLIGSQISSQSGFWSFSAVSSSTFAERTSISARSASFLEVCSARSSAVSEKINTVVCYHKENGFPCQVWSFSWLILWNSRTNRSARRQISCKSFIKIG